MKLSFIIGTLLFILSNATLAAPYDPQITSLYDTLQPERGRSGQPTQQILIQVTHVNGQQVLATASCNPGCIPIVYSYQAEQSATLKKDIYFSNAGIYLMSAMAF